jgi:hypothetical protein
MQNGKTQMGDKQTNGCQCCVSCHPGGGCNSVTMTFTSLSPWSSVSVVSQKTYSPVDSEFIEKIQSCGLGIYFENYFGIYFENYVPRPILLHSVVKPFNRDLFLFIRIQ